ncbi:CYB5D2 [Cordylochernes scorpioides]|uniref:CYB5D2 n=1 Tax=Cordylochernes scorpioides TaxID=51811 RepID=A0ABY6L7U8_9ARAC|nr:CYB5D2 [Cordylochernes scorpioides]
MYTGLRKVLYPSKDATRAFVTGEFSGEDELDSIDDFDDDSLISLEEWQSFYKEDYIYVGHDNHGKLVGRYYDSSGQPTQALLDAYDRIAKAKAHKVEEEEKKKKFPPCNSEWFGDTKSGRVWCTNKSGGISRDWVGVPRQLYTPGKSHPSCVCVRAEGPPSDNPNSSENSGDLEHPGLQEYPGCSTMSAACRTTA